MIHQFRAIFEGENVTRTGEIAGRPSPRSTAVVLGSAGDTLTDNNTAEAFTFVRGKGKVLYIDNVADGTTDSSCARRWPKKESTSTIASASTSFPRSLVELQNYDAVILANVPRGCGGLDDEQQKMLASYVHDMGGGLVMIGGDQTFGAGGWGGSKLEEVLPVNMDIPAQRQMPQGRARARSCTPARCPTATTGASSAH